MVSTSIKTCPVCGKDFKVIFGKKNKHGKYCSRKCYVASLTPRKTKKKDSIITTGAITRIRYLSDGILKQLDADTFAGLKKDLEDYISMMTEKRYYMVSMDSSIPKGFIRPDGKLLSYNLLSAGTQDVLSLALRLAMANYFLKEANGYLMMDAPLVNMDP